MWVSRFNCGFLNPLGFKSAVKCFSFCKDCGLRVSESGLGQEKKGFWFRAMAIRFSSFPWEFLDPLGLEHELND